MPDENSGFPPFKEIGPVFDCYIDQLRLDWHHRNNGEKYLVPDYEDGLFDMVCSFREHGAQLPIRVYLTYGPGLSDYTLVDGYMRVLASIALGLETIPAILVERSKTDDNDPK